MRTTLASMSSVLAVQRKGWGDELCCSMNSWMAAIHGATLWKVPRPKRLNLFSRTCRASGASCAVTPMKPRKRRGNSSLFDALFAIAGESMLGSGQGTFIPGKKKRILPPPAGGQENPPAAFLVIRNS